MDNRLKLHELLCSIIKSRNVYYQAPGADRMKYPAIVYGVNRIDIKSANNDNYITKRQYILTLISIDPDTDLIDKCLMIPGIRFNRHYKKDNLNHYVFTLFF